MYYNSPQHQRQHQQQQQQEGTMNLLISPFQPDQYGSAEYSSGRNNSTQPLDVPPMQQPSHSYHSSGGGGIDMLSNSSFMLPHNTLYNQSPSPQLDLVSTWKKIDINTTLLRLSFSLFFLPLFFFL